MGLKKGQTNNPEGRPKGSRNKVNKELRKMIKDFLEENLENFQEEFAELETKDKLKFITDLLPYGLSKYQPTEMKEKGTHMGMWKYESMMEEINQQLRESGYKCKNI